MAENSDGDKKPTPVEAWNRALLALCDAVLVTPTSAISNQRWAEAEFAMRKMEGILGELWDKETPAKIGEVRDGVRG